MGIDADLQTPLAFAEMDPPEDPSIIFYREPRAPDLNIDPADFDADIIENVPILWFPASRFSDERAGNAVSQLLAIRKRKSHTTVLDLDWRPMFLGFSRRRDQSNRTHARALHHCDWKPR